MDDETTEPRNNRLVQFQTQFGQVRTDWTSNWRAGQIVQDAYAAVEAGRLLKIRRNGHAEYINARFIYTVTVLDENYSYVENI